VIPIFIGALDLTVVSAVLPHVILDLEIPLQTGLDDAAWIPIYFDVENWLVKPYVQGFKIPPIKIPKFQYVSIAESE